MNINADFTQRVLLHSSRLKWQDSPMPGVQRRPLDRVGDELARATSIVRYDPDSRFSPHVHTGGEEFIVLSGVFQDEHGDYPAGSYVRNPPQSRHTPGSAEGCIIFVKLWQFDPDDRQQLTIDMHTTTLSADPARPGIRSATLYQDAFETVRLEHWEAGQTIELDTTGGAECLVLDGGLTESGEQLETLSWLRIPVDGGFTATAGSSGARVWLKTGHLRYVNAQREAVASVATHPDH